MRICVYGAASNEIDTTFISDGEKLGEQLAKKGHSLVFGGGANGLMGAVARGVYKQKGTILSIAPNFFNVDGILYEHCTEYIYTDTMRERKMLMEEHSDAFIVTPGGIGTFEEFFEILTLRSLDRHKKPIAILNTNGYYDNLIEFLKIGVKQNFLKDENLNLFFVSESVDDVIKYLENYSDNTNKSEITRFV